MIPDDTIPARMTLFISNVLISYYDRYKSPKHRFPVAVIEDIIVGPFVQWHAIQGSVPFIFIAFHPVKDPTGLIENCNCVIGVQFDVFDYKLIVDAIAIGCDHIRGLYRITYYSCKQEGCTGWTLIACLIHRCHSYFMQSRA